LKKEIFEDIKKELLNLGILFFIVLVIFKIVFFKEQFFVLIKTVLSLFWLFVLPGYFAILYWKNKLDFIERLVMGIVLGISMVGITSYYLGLTGLHIKFHFIVLPPLIIVIGGFLYLRKNKVTSS